VHPSGLAVVLEMDQGLNYAPSGGFSFSWLWALWPEVFGGSLVILELCPQAKMCPARWAL